MNISAPFIVRPIATALLMVGLTIVGGVAYMLLPVAPLPQVDFPTIQVTAQLPGTSPETMASSVATPLERQFAQISGRRPAHLGERHRHHLDHHPVRSRAQHRCRRPGRSGRDQRRRRAAAEEFADPADLSEDQSLRRAGHAAGA